jgi:hypothetical protein
MTVRTPQEVTRLLHAWHYGDMANFWLYREMRHGAK